MSEQTLYDIISKILLLDNKDINDDITRTDLEEWDTNVHNKFLPINQAYVRIQLQFNTYYGAIITSALL